MKINIKNAEKIEKALNEAQKRARSRLLDIETIAGDIQKIEEQLKESKIKKKNWTGTTILVDPHRVSNSYARQWWNAETTTAKLVRGKTDWFLVDVGRQRCDKCAYGTNDAFPVIL